MLTQTLSLVHKRYFYYKGWVTCGVQEFSLWWAWMLTATSRHPDTLIAIENKSPLSGGRESNVIAMFAFILCACLLVSLPASAEQSESQKEDSGWEISIANGLFLFKREKSTESQKTKTDFANDSASAEPNSTGLTKRNPMTQVAFGPDFYHGESAPAPDYRQQARHSDGNDELFLPDTESIYMPAVGTHFRSEISGIVARSTVIQTFKNPTDEWLQGTYQFPLPEDSAVDFLKMRIGKREIVGEIKRKQEARRAFKKAMASGQKASLVEQQKPHMFTTSLANIAPYEEIEIEIQFQQQARYVDGEFRLRFPTTFIPRAMLPFIHAPDAAEQTLSFATGTFSPAFEPNFTADIKINAGGELAYLRSPAYVMVSEQYDDFNYFLTMGAPQFGDRDLELTWRYISDSPKVLHYREARDEGEYGLLMIIPPGSEIKQKGSPEREYASREITFVIDTSGSMQGQSIIQAKEALTLAVRSLHQNDSFNIIEFNSYAKEMWGAPRIASYQNKEIALTYLNKLFATGGTNIFNALNQAFLTQRDSDKLKQLVFITDGAIGYEEQLLEELEKKLGDLRLFTVGIGSAPNSYFMVEAAKVGRGSFIHIANTTQVRERMSQLLQQLAKPSLTNIVADFGMPVDMYPKKIPDLYSGEPIVLSYLAPQAVADINIKGQTANESWQQNLYLQNDSDSAGIAKQWAQDKIRSLSRQLRLTPANRGQSEEMQNIVEDITQTALNHHLVSRYTSLIAIEKEPIVEKKSVDATELSDKKTLETLSKSKAQPMMASMPNTAAGSNHAFTIALVALFIAMLFSLSSFIHGKVGRKAFWEQNHVSQ